MSIDTLHTIQTSHFCFTYTRTTYLIGRRNPTHTSYTRSTLSGSDVNNRPSTLSNSVRADRRKFIRERCVRKMIRARRRACYRRYHGLAWPCRVCCDSTLNHYGVLFACDCTSRIVYLGAYRGQKQNSCPRRLERHETGRFISLTSYQYTPSRMRLRVRFRTFPSRVERWKSISTRLKPFTNRRCLFFLFFSFIRIIVTRFRRRTRFRSYCTRHPSGV